MAIDLTGISNVNEFYTDHYLATYFEQSVTETMREWRADAEASGAQTLYQRLRDVGKLFNRLYGKSGGGRRRYATDDAIEMVESYLESLGYPEGTPEHILLPSGTTLPLFREFQGGDGHPRVWVLVSLPSDDQDLFSASPADLSDEAEPIAPEISVEQAVDELMLDVSSPARFVILASPAELALIDREKWGEKRFLSFDMEEIFRRREESTIQAAATLLAMTSLCAKEGGTLIDELDRQAREHASEVSDSLRYALRECVELLGNEVIYDWTHNKDNDLDAQPIDAGELTIECLRYMYRILFLLFMEARPELGFAPTKAESYQRAYSLESVREIAESYREGIDAGAGDTDFIDRTLRLTCDLVYNGYPTNELQYRELMDQGSTRDVFVVPPLKAHIFDRQRTLLVDGARLRDSVMLQIVDRMSYTRPARGRAERVSYGTLGINQLGSVYEALLSYRGFIASERLYEVKRARDSFDPLDVGYFVTEGELGLYSEDERVRHEAGPQRGQLRTYEKGHFIYRLAGREREQSASYYTPESLTQCLVKYALKELLEGKSADEILQLTVCEPAMGSAAFLNEVINQLAEAYLTRRQEELGESIPHDQRQLELQRVKMLIADRNVYGIDLNPIAIELGEVSLWLNTISQDGYVPWFGNQLHCGNSLIGARRQGYTERDLSTRTRGLRWYDHEPERVSFKTGCSKSHRVYHFLVGDPGMSRYDDRVIKSLEPQQLEAIKRWNRAFVAPYGTDEIRSLRELSYEVDRLWTEQVKQQRLLRQNTIDRLECYGFKDTEGSSHTSIRQKDRLLSMFYHSEHARNAGPYARLKFAMDYWCSLWFWPIEQADLLPTRDEFLMHMSFILVGTTERVAGVRNQSQSQMAFDFGDGFETAEQLTLGQMQEEFGSDKVVDLDDLCEKFPTLELARQIAERQHFFHWELEFADVFEARGGFDLVLGNPPWIKLEWNEKGVLSDKDPSFAVKDLNVNQTAERRSAALEDPAALSNYLEAYVAMTGQKGFLNAVQNYPLLKGIQADLYKCFLPQAWYFSSIQGISAFIHPEGIHNDPNGAAFRKVLYTHLTYHFQFQNELLLFRGIHHNRMFSLNVYTHFSDLITSISNLFSPSTVDECFETNAQLAVEGIKDSNGRWNTAGHPERVVNIRKEDFETFSRVFSNGDLSDMKLPAIHCVQFMNVLCKVANCEDTMGSYGSHVFSTQMWNETAAQANGIIENSPSFPHTRLDMVYCGPNITLSNPLFKCSRRLCRLNSDYDVVDLTNISDDYLLRSKYVCLSPNHEATWSFALPWGGQYANQYRLFARKMIDPRGQRTLHAAIVPPGVAHIHGISGFAFDDDRLLAYCCGLWSSLPFDFLIKILNKANLHDDNTRPLPIPKTILVDEITYLSLRLNCLTEHYSQLWSACWKDSYATFEWAERSTLLKGMNGAAISQEWTNSVPLRTDYERRYALAELDVLSAMALGLTLEELEALYRIQFPVLQKDEASTWFDKNGRIAFTGSRSLPGVGMDSRSWSPEIEGLQVGSISKTVTDDTVLNGPVEHSIVFEAPFITCDRVRDYRTIWAFFEGKYGAKETDE